MRSISGPLGVIVKGLLRRLLRFATSDFEAATSALADSFKDLARQNNELRNELTVLQQAVRDVGHETRFVAGGVTAMQDDIRSICRDAVRARAGAVELRLIQLRLADIYSEVRRLELQLESELSASGAQRSFAQREIQRLGYDLELHIETCGQPTKLGYRPDESLARSDNPSR